MSTTRQREQGDGRVESADCSTLQTSQSDQARGYLESLTDNDFIAEIQSALKHAQRLTKQSWKVVVTADDIEIQAVSNRAESNRAESKKGEGKRIKLPKPKSLQ